MFNMTAKSHQLELYSDDELRRIEAMLRLKAISQKRQITWILVLTITGLFSVSFIATVIKTLLGDIDLRASLTLIGAGGALATSLIIVFKHYFPSKRSVDKNRDDNGDNDEQV